MLTHKHTHVLNHTITYSLTRVHKQTPQINTHKLPTTYKVCPYHCAHNPPRPRPPPPPLQCGTSRRWEQTAGPALPARLSSCVYPGSLLLLTTTIVCWLLNVPATCYCVSQGRICSDNFTCCHTETGAAEHTFYLTQSQYTDTGPTSPSTDPITPSAWQG